ncbi:RES family NAD+ phosphorylase [Caulobacter sp.]|uniref:RES family NAD+ phosphorylase n=1 Tax=Caulobacter sp. TaxID=78 RepID=UPI003BA94F0D
MRNVVDDVSLIEWEGNAYRLIPSRFPPISIYAGLVRADRTAALVEVESLTNPRLQSAERLMAASLAIPANSPRLQNWNHAPFAYSNPEGGRFFPPERPCLELADGHQTALAISVARRQRFLGRTEEPAIGLDMRMLKTPVAGRFFDLRTLDPATPTSALWAYGAQVPLDADGVLYHPPERPSATCLAVLKASALGRSLQTVHYRFVWNGRQVSSLYAFDQEGRVLPPERLSSDEDVLAA